MGNIKNTLKHLTFTFVFVFNIFLGCESTWFTGVTTRYWDCCKPSCAWPGKSIVNRPVETCYKNGSVIRVKGYANIKSGCEGGESFACENNAPFVISKNVSYGFVAAKLQNMDEGGWCCACYELVFTTDPVKGKKMIVQVTNTGYDLGDNHFDLHIPGGGQGIFRGCNKQYDNFQGGELFGGVANRKECDKLPKKLQLGCRWRFDWFKNADNPDIIAKRVPCPHRLVRISKCTRT